MINYKMIKQFIKAMLIKTSLYKPKNYIDKPKIVAFYGDRKILGIQEGNDYIFQLLSKNEPCIISRFGSTELSIVYNYLQIQNNKKNKWNPQNIKALENNSGFFPADSQSVTKFSEVFSENITHIDALGVWFNEVEDIISEKYCSQAQLIRLESIEPYYHANPWSRILENKKVLVVHPFAQSIQKQYTQNREFLFADKGVLPVFSLETIQAVQSLADNKKKLPFKTWFEALDYMCKEISKKDFDIAIIGAGAYGLPLASFVKSIGKQAIHMAGATQILFGIWGNRWENVPNIKKLKNDYWIRPSEEEKPKGAENVEGACYW